MKAVIDTASLFSLVRYYLPFDKERVLFQLLKNKIKNGEIIIIDKVLQECSYLSKGIILKKLPYLSDPEFLKSAKLPINTKSIIAPSPAKFLRQLDNQFVNTAVKKMKKLSDVEYESQKKSALEGADMKLVIYCLTLIRESIFNQVYLVTEETKSSNDNKLFQKIPFICKELNIDTLTLPELLAGYSEIDLEFIKNID
jgi:hypothetical protein